MKRLHSDSSPSLGSIVRWRGIVGLILFALLATACSNELDIRDTSLASDTRDGRGPFEVVTTVNSDIGLDQVTLHYRPVGEDWAEVAMKGEDEARYRGSFTPFDYGREQAWPNGTRIQFYVEATNADGVVRRDPPQAPEGVYDFIIGSDRSVVLEVQPDEGPESGGTRVFIRGAGFHGESIVRFGPNEAAEAVVVSPTFIRATTPPGEGGLVDVIVVDPSGNEGVLNDGFRYIPAPEILLVEPDSGPTAGGTEVTITGQDFVDPTVTFDGLTAERLAWTDAEIVVRTPPHPEGAVDVVVTNQSDGQFDTAPAAYTYIPPPVVIAVEPPFGPVAGGTQVVVVGQGFQEGASVTFDGLDTACSVVTETEISCTTEPHPAGVVDVTVTNPDGQSGTGAEVYEYLNPPTITAVIPDEGPLTGGTPVTIEGTGFIPGAEVSFGGVPAPQCTVLSRTEIACTTPPFPTEGFVDVTVLNPDGQSDTLQDGFEYTFPPPNIVDISPDRGSDLGGTTVTLTVEWLKPGATVSFDGIPCDIVSVDPANNTIVCVTRPGTEGFVDVTVTVEDQSDTEIDGYEYLGPPRIFAINPDQGVTDGGTTVTITGENFAPGLVVEFDGRPATVVSVSEGTIVVETPPHPRGFVDVTVTNPDGRSDTAADGYEYIWPPPVILSLNPDEGGTWGGNEVLIDGTGFRPGDTVVTVGGVPLSPADYIVSSENLIQILRMPPGAGPVDVVVTNSDGQSDSAVYTYVPIELEPPGGLTSGFTRVEVRGFDFTAGTTVTVDGIAAFSVDVQSPNLMVVQSPAGSLGNANVLVTLPDGRSETLVDGYQYRKVGSGNAATGLSASPFCQDLEIADFNGDGRDDVLVGNGSVDTNMDINLIPPNTVQLNNGNLAFGTLVDLPLGERTINLDVADYDGDGDVDILDVNLDNTTRLLRNNGQAGFTVSGALPFAPQSLYDAGFMDLENDGDQDIFLLSHTGDDSLLRNANGNYTSLPLVQDSAIQNHDHDMAVGDVNGDGFPDVIATVDNTEQAGGTLRFQGRNRLYVNNGMGGFTLDTSQPFSSINGDILDVQLVDVDNDGDLDVVMSDNIFPGDPLVTSNGHVRNSVYLYTNDGNGNFTDDRNRIPQGLTTFAYGVTLSDLDIDGDLDMVVATCPDTNAVNLPQFRRRNLLFVNDGDGFFQTGNISLEQSQPFTCTIVYKAVDLDGDSIPELVSCVYDEFDNVNGANQVLKQVAQ